MSKITGGSEGRSNSKIEKMVFAGSDDDEDNDNHLDIQSDWKIL
jgi:hypothetical protein